MGKMHECEKVGPEWLEEGDGWRFGATAVVDCSPEEMFELMKGTEVWKVMLDLDVTWEADFGPNTARTVSGGLTALEQFYAWEEGKRMAFRFDNCSIRHIAAFAEDFSVGPGPSEGQCELVWKGALRLRGAMYLASPLFAFVMNRNGKSAMKKLQAFVKDGGASGAVATSAQ